MARQIDNITIEDAKIRFKNFAGAPDKFNPRGGKRTFNVLIEDPDMAQKLAEDGWNIRILQGRDPDEEPVHTIQVEVSFNNYPPAVWMVTERGTKTRLDEETIAELDNARILTADIIISPYCWEVNGKSGVKAYLKTLYATIEEDKFAAKYDFD